jgi:hypothetical protein
MFPPHWFLPYDAIFQLITAFIALAVAMYALRGHRWVQERTLYALFLAFLMLSVGMFVNGLTLTYTYIFDISFKTSSSALSIADIGFWAYYIVSMIAYSLLIFAYTSRLRESSIVLAGGLFGAGSNGSGGGGTGGGGTGGSSLLTLGPFMEMILVILLIIVVIAQLAHLVVKRNRYSIMVTLSFLLLLMSHILIMFSSLEDIVYVAGRFLELFGFVALFAVLYGLRRSG